MILFFTINQLQRYITIFKVTVVNFTSTNTSDTTSLQFSDFTTTDKIPDGYIDGYSIPVYGLDNGSFFTIHIPALVCLGISLLCAIVVVVYSFYNQHISTFFEWSKCERFVIYMALCDGLFNFVHFADHLNIVIVKRLPTPKSLCDLYGFLMAEFITAQNLMVNIVAMNVFVLIYFRKKIDFGRWDHRLLIYIFGTPALGLIIVGALGQLGPNGSFCYFDGVNGKVPNMIYTTILLTSIFIANIVLYILSWTKIYRDTKAVKKYLGKSSRGMRASHRAAKTMSLFVTAFFIQWWALAMYGVWQWYDVPIILFHFVTTFSNIGGILNGVVFIIIIRRKRESRTANKELDEKEPSVRRARDNVKSECIQNRTITGSNASNNTAKNLTL